MNNVDSKVLEFLYPHPPDPFAAKGYDQTFFALPDGSDVPAKWPARIAAPTVYDIVVKHFVKNKQGRGIDTRPAQDVQRVLSTLALVSRDWLCAVRKFRFQKLEIIPPVDLARLVEVYRSDAVMPYVRHLHIDGYIIRGKVLPNKQADHRWLIDYIPLIAQLREYAPIDYLSLDDLSWGDLHIALRQTLRSLPHVRALSLNAIDFWNSNQYLKTLNSYPQLQYLRTRHMDWHELTHVPAQVTRAQPLLLSEFFAGCTYTSLLLDWMLGQRQVLAIEEFSVHVRDMYRDDARLARVVRKISPWLKRFTYFEWSGDTLCESAGGNGIREYMVVDGHEDKLSEEISAWIEAHQDDEEIEPTARPTTWELDVHKASESILLPDDEEPNRDVMVDFGSGLFHPPWFSEADHGFLAFAEQLPKTIHTPFLQVIEARIRWTTNFGLLTLKMLCSMTFECDEFYRFDLQFLFPNYRLFKSANWRIIDQLLAEACERLPDDDDAMDEDEEEDEDAIEEDEIEGEEEEVLEGEGEVLIPQNRQANADIRVRQTEEAEQGRGGHEVSGANDRDDEEEQEDDYDTGYSSDLCLTISVGKYKGSPEALYRAMKRRLPRTVRADILRLQVEEWHGDDTPPEPPFWKCSPTSTAAVNVA